MALLRREGDIAIITMNNPASRNPFSAEMKEALFRYFTELIADGGCRAIVLTGAGGNFSASGDIKQMKARPIMATRGAILRSHEILRLMVGGPKPIVAAVEGYAYGAGLALAAACDYAVAADNAKFCCAFLRLGLVPDVGSRWLLTQRVGPAKAKELMTLAREFDAAEALRIGAVNQLSKPGAALAAAIEVAKEYAAKAPLAFASTKAMFVTGGTSMEDTFKSELEYQLVLTTTKDHAEAVSAFLSKRKPVFTGE